MLFAIVRWRRDSPFKALARAAEVTDSSTESCLGNCGVADPWPINERSVLLLWLSALFSAALGEIVKRLLAFFSGPWQRLQKCRTTAEIRADSAVDVEVDGARGRADAGNRTHGVQLPGYVLFCHFQAPR